MSKCTACGADLPEGAAFCENCGAPVNAERESAVAQVTPMTGLITPDPDRPTGRETKASPTLEPGQVFAERYTVEKVIGRGGMGTVYKAIDSVSGKPTALKLINPGYLNGEKAIQRLIEEGVTARDIRHPNVVAVYDVGRAGDQPFVAMEYLDGISLREWHGRMMQKGESIPLRVAARITAEILDGLRAAHEAGVIHRDLKPENITLLKDPTEKTAPLKLLDFGIARATGALSTSSSSTGLGTPDYMAPEQRTNPDTAGPSADLYSLSVMLYELLVGVVPGRHWQPPSGGRADVPQEVDALILKGMSDNRNLRPQSAEQYRKELVAAVNRIPVSNGTVVNNGGTDNDKSGGSPMPWIVGGVSTLAILGLVIAIAVYPTDPEPEIQPVDPPVVPTNLDVVDDEEDDIEPIPPVTPEKPPSLAEYYSGTWADGYGGHYNLRVSQNGAFSGSGYSADGTPVNVRGGISGNSLQYILSVQGLDIASGRGVQTDQCHFNYQTFDGYGNLNLSGTFHVNHEPGEPCP